MGDTIPLSQVPLADLMALYNNYAFIVIHNIGIDYRILSMSEFEAIKKEIQYRKANINFEDTSW